MTGISRRDFLKVATCLPVVAAARKLSGASQRGPNADLPNIIVLVFDAWSAAHLPLYGYARQTMPNLEQFAERAVVFHRHYSVGTFTVPGTATLLTGLHPWSHRALALGGEIASEHRDHHIFSLLGPSCNTLGFAQNEYADLVLSQAAGYLDAYLPSDSFSLQHNLLYTLPIFQNDLGAAHATFENDIFQRGLEADASLFVGPLRRLLRWRSTRALDAEYRMTYPRGLPVTLDQFRLEDVVEGAIRILGSLPRPSLAYLHFYPPHGFYRPKGKFSRSFMDGLEPPLKPVHALSTENPGSDAETSQRLRYDQYMASWDAELGRLFEYLRTSGLLDTSYVFITSDHGEMFERGVIGHYTPLIYDPLVRVPLIVSRPGRTDRIDVRVPTSNVDLLPTIASLTGIESPSWAEGRLLPEFGGTPDPDRSIYIVDAKTNAAAAKLTRVSLSLTKNDYRLTYYQYPELDYARFELYQLPDDPDELHDLYSEVSPVGSRLKDELLQTLRDVNREVER